MLRKVVRQGPSTLMVSLPSKWTKEHNIKKGSELDLELLNNQIVISTQSPEQRKSTVITIDKKEEYMNRVLFTKYREGYDEIIIHYTDPAIVEKIRETLQYLLGFEIVDQNGKSCTIKNIAEGLQENYEQMFKRLFQIVLTMAETATNYVKENNDNKNNNHNKDNKSSNQQQLKTIIELRETLSKILEFSLRLINKQNLLTENKKAMEFFYVWNIGVIGKTWSYLAKELLEEKQSQQKNHQWNQKEIDFFHFIVNYHRLLYDLFYKQKNISLAQLRLQREHLKEKGYTLLETSKKKQIIHHLLSIGEKIHDVSTTFS